MSDAAEGVPIIQRTNAHPRGYDLFPLKPSTTRSLAGEGRISYTEVVKLAGYVPSPHPRAPYSVFLHLRAKRANLRDAARLLGIHYSAL